MKKISITLVIILTIISFQSKAQDTLRIFSRTPHHREYHENYRNQDNNEIRTFSSHNHSNGFYIGFHSDFSQIAGYDAFGGGASLAWITDHNLAFGFSGKGFFTEPQPYPGASNKDFNYTGGYGGFLIEPILFPKSPVHLSFPVLLGAGGIAKGVYYDLYYPYEYTDGYVDEADAFLIAEPGVELEINAARWIRLGFGFSYRFTQGIDAVHFDENPLDGWTTGFSLKFGKF